MLRYLSNLCRSIESLQTMLYLVSRQYDPASISSISFLLMCCYCYLKFCIGHQSYSSKIHWNRQIIRALKFGQFHCAFLFLVLQKNEHFWYDPLGVLDIFAASVRSRSHSVVAKNFCVLVDVSNDDFFGGNFFPMDCNAFHPLIPFKSDPFGKKVIIDWYVYWSSVLDQNSYRAGDHFHENYWN